MKSHPNGPFVTACAAALLASLPTVALAQYGQQPSGGGLSSLPPMQRDPAQPGSVTEAQLQKGDREDSGRGLEFVWLNGEVGMQHLGLQTFKANDIVDANVVKTTQTGPVYGVGAGVRLVFLTVGARFRLANFDQYQLWTLAGELGIRIPLGDLEPYFTLGGGYAKLGSFDANQLSSSGIDAGAVDITGYTIRGGFGIDYYLSSAFSLGVNLTGDVVGLTRPGVDPRKISTGGTGSSAQASAEVYAADGSSVGVGGTLTAVAGLHF